VIRRVYYCVEALSERSFEYQTKVGFDSVVLFQGELPAFFGRGWRDMSRARTQSRRSRKCLLLAGVIFLAVQLGVGLILDRSLLKIRFSFGSKVMDSAATLSRSPDILFMGSSRLRGGLNMKEFREFMSKRFGEDAPLMFNAAVPAGDPFVMDRLLRFLSDQGIMPKIAIVEVSLETVKLRSPWMDYQVSQLITWQDLPDALPDFIASKNVSHLLSTRLIPVYLYRKELLSWIFDSSPPYLKAASEPGAAPAKPANQDGLNDLTPERANAGGASSPVPPEVAKMFRNYRIGGINAQHLESMLAFLRQRKVEVILLGTPASKYHLSCYTPEINKKFLDHMDYLTRTYGCSFVDYRARVPHEYFKDELHLNQAGALFFSRMLADELLQESWMNLNPALANGARQMRPMGSSLSGPSL
jgi:hypothetical protein